MRWKVVYKQAIQKDGSILFPERFSKEYLDDLRKTQGSYLFANQYQNIVIPDDEKRFDKSWLRLYSQIPDNHYTFIFIDPAIGQKDNHDFTGVAVVSVDSNRNWYARMLARYKVTPSEIVNLIFRLNKEFNPRVIGVETIAYQEALLYMIENESRIRNEFIPVTGISQRTVSKQVRILGLVPLFEFGRIFINTGMSDFIDEYSFFPRASHDDILDALASISEIVYYPVNVDQKRDPERGEPGYESFYIRKLAREQQNQSEFD